MDVAPLDVLSVPVLSPQFGFSSITAPEITLETEEIREGNWPFARKVVKSGSVGSITMTRGATFFDSDFYRWIMATATGDAEVLQSKAYGIATALSRGGDFELRNAASLAAVGLGLMGFPRIGGATIRRDMVLIQFFQRSPGFDGLLGTALVSGQILAAGGIGTAQAAGIISSLTWAEPSLFGNPVSSAAIKLPARAWKLEGCIPTRYKTATDFDASSSEVSIMELEMEVEGFEEVSLAGS